MHILSEYIFDGYEIISDGFVEYSEDGTILNLGKISELNSETIDSARQVTGLLLPGFVNTHCHLELSHLQNRVASGTGLLPFLESVMSLRESDPIEIASAIERQDEYMWNQGIQAVGDISNKADTIPTKLASPITYYSFVEMFDLLAPKLTDRTYEQYIEVYNQYKRSNLLASAVPHAPYTVTPELFARINETNGERTIVSIHNQETEAEDQLFILGSGPFLPFYENLKLPLTNFQPTYKSSIHYAIEHMDAHHEYLFVHNTQTTENDILEALQWNRHIYWCTCPNANLYIENRLPKYQVFMNNGATMTIGTDSLTSNWQLSILEELKTINRYNSYIPVVEILKWSTINGARALGLSAKLGSIEVGKQPGLIHLTHFSENDIQSCEVTRVI